MAPFSPASLRLRRRLRWVADRPSQQSDSIFATAPIGNAVLDRDDRIVEANAALARIGGHTAKELVGRSLASLLQPADVITLREQLAELRDGRRDGIEAELRCLRAPVTVSVHAAALHDATGRRDDRVLVQVIDVTARKRFEEELRHLADHDPLSGLFNRRRFEQELERHVAFAKRYGLDGAVLLLDVDRFKRVNDTHGHQAGDELIARVATALRGALRTTDTLARLGGDEFAVLLPRANRAVAETVAAKLVAAMRSVRLAAPYDVVGPITISAGAVLVADTSALSAGGLVEDADAAMYLAKTAGRDRFAVFSPRAADSALAA